MILKTPHMLVTLYRSYRIIEELHKERNFNVKNDGETMQLIIDLVKQRTLTNKQIKQEVMEIHTIEMIELEYPQLY